MTVGQFEFRDAMAQLGAAVSIITTDGAAGRCGFTASAVCSVTDTPPTLLVCLNSSSQQLPVFEKNGVLCVNVLAASQVPYSALFAGQTGASMQDRFAAVDWKPHKTGSPMLAGAAACLDCEIVERLSRGTHSVFLCKVIGVELAGTEAGGLIWFGRSYHSVGGQENSVDPY